MQRGRISTQIRMNVRQTFFDKIGEGVRRKFLPLVCQEIIVSHIHNDARQSSPGRRNQPPRRAGCRMRVGIGVNGAMQANAGGECIIWNMRAGPPQKIRQKIAGLNGDWVICRKIQMGQQIHGAAETVARASSRPERIDDFSEIIFQFAAIIGVFADQRELFVEQGEAAAAGFRFFRVG